LHQTFTPGPARAVWRLDPSPVYETEETDFGVRLVAIRKAGPDQQYVRFSSLVMPVFGCVPAGRGPGEFDGFEIHMYVPFDDMRAWRYDMGFRRSRPVREEEVHRRKQIGPDYVRLRNARNAYLQDRQAQKTVNYTGIEDFLNHDACATESMGPIYDRSKEHLGVSDKAVIAVRKYLLNAVKTLQEGKEPPHLIRAAEQNRFPHIDCFAHLLPSGTDWREHFRYLSPKAKAENPAAFTAKKKAVS
jgi:hypothetical protein